ncbi:MAG: sel1 repeat family protein, partial [Clostridia bacterium]|nr:sel1 repeat family protein [Clostridia bacterium]
PKDIPNALKWLEKAVEQDYAPAMTALAAMYMFGDGVKVNGKKAVELLTKAIELGDDEALFVRGVCSEKGIGVEKSAEDAQAWYAKAAEKGVTESALMA